GEGDVLAPGGVQERVDEHGGGHDLDPVEGVAARVGPVGVRDAGAPDAGVAARDAGPGAEQGVGAGVVAAVAVGGVGLAPVAAVLPGVRGQVGQAAGRLESAPVDLDAVAVGGADGGEQGKRLRLVAPQ